MVSVIIPVYNGAEFLEECLRSVMNQSYCALEIIVINDGSTDDSGKICERLAQEDDRIVVLHQENAGVSVARNKGIANARGEYIMFVDADDTMPLSAVELLVNDIEATNADMSIGVQEMFRWQFRNKKMHERRKYLVEDLRENVVLAEKLLQSPCGRVYRRKPIITNKLEFEPNVPYGEDTRFNLEYCNSIQSISVINETVYHCRMGGFASSRRFYPTKMNMAFALVEEYGFFLKKDGKKEDDSLCCIIYKNMIDCFCHFTVNTRSRVALKYIDRTIEVFSPYLNEKYIAEKFFGKKLAKAILQKKIFEIYILVWCQFWSVITKRKIKKVYYKFFSRHI